LENQTIAVFVNMKTKQFQSLSTWKPNNSSLCQHENQTIPVFVSMKTKQFQSLSTWNPKDLKQSKISYSHLCLSRLQSPMSESATVAYVWVSYSRLCLSQLQSPMSESATVAYVWVGYSRLCPSRLQSPMSERKNFRFNNNYIIYEL
jgi:ribosomal protein L39E